MRKEELFDFLNPSQQQALKDYHYFDTSQSQSTSLHFPLKPIQSKIPFKPRDYLKFMNKYNYQLMEGGIVIETHEYPIIKLKSYDKTRNSFSKFDLSQLYVFYKKNNKKTRRDFFEELLENLEKRQLKKSP